MSVHPVDHVALKCVCSSCSAHLVFSVPAVHAVASLRIFTKCPSSQPVALVFLFIGLLSARLVLCLSDQFDLSHHPGSLPTVPVLQHSHFTVFVNRSLQCSSRFRLRQFALSHHYEPPPTGPVLDLFPVHYSFTELFQRSSCLLFAQSVIVIAPLWSSSQTSCLLCILFFKRSSYCISLFIQSVWVFAPLWNYN